MPSLSLYSYFRSSCSYRVRIGLYLKGLNFSYQTVNLAQGAQFVPEFIKMNPLAQLPCLQVGKKQILSQSLPILLYLEAMAKEPALLPKEPFQRSEILSFCELINSGIQPLQNLSVLKYVEEKGLQDRKNWAGHWINKGLFACNVILKPVAKNFCFGNQLSMADVFLIPQLYNALRFGVDLEPFPLLKKIHRHCLGLSAFQKALPENQPDAR